MWYNIIGDNMKHLVIEMRHIWNVKNIDWMGYRINKGDSLSFHHVVKKEHHGKYEMDNGALLNCNSSHPYLHLIENKDLELYIYLNNLLKNINSQREFPSKQQLLAIDAILRQFEREHCSDRNNKGKFLIKSEFYDRMGVRQL